MNDIAKIEPKQETILSVIERIASDPNADIAKLEKMLDLQEKVLNRNAEMAFNVAMNETQAHMSPISADATNPQTKSRYASYAQLDKALRPIYSGNGFSLSFGTEPNAAPDMMTIICDVSHRSGFTKRYQVQMPSDGKGAKGGDVMTKTHAAGSAMTYGMRYLLKLIFNVAIGENDDDGNGAELDDLVEAVNNIKSAETIEALHATFKAMWNAYPNPTDRKRLTHAKDARKKELS